MMTIYNNVREVPKSAQKTITGGRLKGMTDINPQWRIQTLTEQFGMVGIGWYYTIDKQWLEQSGEEIAAFCDISLHIKVGGEWSMPIQGTGGAMFREQERGGLHTSDECFKMALTDAISVACKAIGIGADIYWADGRTKYNKPTTTAEKQCDYAARRAEFAEAYRASGMTSDQYGIFLMELVGTGRISGQDNTKWTSGDWDTAIAAMRGWSRG